MKTKKQAFKAAVFTALTVITAALIFFFSAQAGEESASFSNGITRQIFNLFPWVSELPPEVYEAKFYEWHTFVRMMGHCFEFFTLSVFASLMWKFWDIGWPSLIGFITSALYAISDEIHQAFVPGRAAEITDVLVDCLGAFVGAFIIYLIINAKRSRERKKNNNYVKQILQNKESE